MYAVTLLAALNAAPPTVVNHADVIIKSSVRTRYSVPLGGGSHSVQHGSGTVVKVSGNRFWVVTCYHVAHADGYMGGDLTVTTHTGKSHKARVVSYCPVRDCSVLVCEGKPDALPCPVVRSDSYRPGDEYVKCGYPRAGRRSVLKGLATKLEYQSPHDHRIRSVICDVRSIPGDSGGGLLRNGKLAGVVWGCSEHGLTAVRIEDVRRCLEVAGVEVD